MSSSPDPMSAFLRGLKGFVRSLPSEEERGELLRTLRSTRDFLDEIQRLVQEIPTLESSQELSHAMTRLDVLAAEARNNPGLSKVLGMPKTGAGRAKRQNGESEIADQAQRLGASVESMEKSEIERSLERSGESVAVLKSLAGRLGLRVRSTERRGELIQRIASHIENERSYRLLRGDAPESVSRPPKAKVS